MRNQPTARARTVGATASTTIEAGAPAALRPTAVTAAPATRTTAVPAVATTSAPAVMSPSRTGIVPCQPRASMRRPTREAPRVATPEHMRRTSDTSKELMCSSSPPRRGMVACWIAPRVQKTANVRA